MTKGFKIYTEPKNFGLLDPQWDKHTRNKYIQFAKGCFKAVILWAVFIAIFMAYKGCEKAKKIDITNKTIFLK